MLITAFENGDYFGQKPSAFDQANLSRSHQQCKTFEMTIEEMHDDDAVALHACLQSRARLNCTAQKLQTHPAISREMKSCSASSTASGSDIVRPKCGIMPSAYVTRLARSLSKYSSLKP